MNALSVGIQGLYINDVRYLDHEADYISVGTVGTNNTIVPQEAPYTPWVYYKRAH